MIGARKVGSSISGTLTYMYRQALSYKRHNSPRKVPKIETLTCLITNKKRWDINKIMNYDLNFMKNSLVSKLLNDFKRWVTWKYQQYFGHCIYRSITFHLRSFFDPKYLLTLTISYYTLTFLLLYRGLAWK